MGIVKAKIPKVPKVLVWPPNVVLTPADPFALSVGQAFVPGLDFALNPQARRRVWPNRVRKTATDCMFASGCSPPHLAVTQLPSATRSGHLLEEDFHLPDRACFQAHGFPPSRE